MKMFFKTKKIPETIAAVDLGSNSFHLIIAEYKQGNIRTIDHIREPVGLSRDLKETGLISDKARSRALNCLEKFGQRVKDIPAGWVSAVGTNTFRKAHNASQFLEEAQLALGHPIEIISGPEEARLIYLGVAHGQIEDKTRRLVFDIGGSSSELIFGVGTKEEILESFDVGCVTLTRQHFADGPLSEKKMRRAEIHTCNLFEQWADAYRQEKWDLVIGTSGTIRTVDKLMVELGLSREGITKEGLEALTSHLIKLKSCDEISKNLSVDKTRANNLPGGLAILKALFATFEINIMLVSEKALRQGLLYDLVSSTHHDDIRKQSIAQLANKFSTDSDHAKRVLNTTNTLYLQVCQDWGLEETNANKLIQWAIPIHEIGLSISHSQHHKHGAYLIQNCDLLGFSRQEQKVLALLVRAHRRKLHTDALEGFSPETLDLLIKVITLIRLAVVFNRNRSDHFAPEVELSAKNNSLLISFPEHWLAAHPLTAADMDYEAGVLKAHGMKLKFN